jgi:hypothetical protein
VDLRDGTTTYLKAKKTFQFLLHKLCKILHFSLNFTVKLNDFSIIKSNNNRVIDQFNVQNIWRTQINKMAAVGFEPTPPKRLVPKTSALDRSATLPYTSSELKLFKSFISTLNERWIARLTNINDMWCVYKFDEKWTQLQTQKYNVIRFFHKLKSYQTERLTQDVERTILESARLMKDEDLDRLQPDQSLEELNLALEFTAMSYL